MKDKGKWFKTDDLRTLIARVQDFFNIDLGYLVDKLLELERLASKQNPTKPISLVSDVDEKIGNIVFAKGVKIYKCQCGKLINFKDSFCRNCGQKQDW